MLLVAALDRGSGASKRVHGDGNGGVSFDGFHGSDWGRNLCRSDAPLRGRMVRRCKGEVPALLDPASSSEEMPKRPAGEEAVQQLSPEGRRRRLVQGLLSLSLLWRGDKSGESGAAIDRRD